jgi:Protein of unknown function (DUF3048) N-terminal domain/Protein of unknown function (DUF3048) C-terminal domain
VSVGRPLRPLLAAGLALALAGCASAAPSGSPVAATEPSSAPPTPTAQPTPTPSPTPQPTPTPSPTPQLARAPLTGLPIEPDRARRPVVALMIDDHPDARPQSGLSSADVVWHAPAEGGIPRYLALYQSRMLGSDIGPIRSARVYFVLWAAEWRALYGHSGGSPQALRLLREQGQGEYVFGANEFRYGGGAFGRVDDRPAPHDIYTDAQRMRRLSLRLGAEEHDQGPVWTFGADAPLDARPAGGTISVPYPHNTVSYAYDRETNTYLRAVSGERRQTDAATERQVAPKNVVIMHVRFIDTGDSKSRLEGDVVGSGDVEVYTNGGVVTGTWQKDGDTDPTIFLDEDGSPIVLTAGQTFIQVVPTDLKVTVKPGTPPS